MGTELVAMSKKELERLEVMRRVVEGRLTQAKAGEFIGLSERQVRRLCAAFKERGPAGLVSGKRGRPSNRRLPDELRLQAIEAIGPIRGVLPTRRFLPAVTKRSRP
ncbi:MAG TPA: helix-turn-helix domain-containing protein, partial [Myxococcales bacterium]